MSLKVRLKQFFCKHKGNIGWSCYSKGVNKKEGHWNVTYSCRNCGMSYSKWIKADEKEVEELFDKEIHRLD